MKWMPISEAPKDGTAVLGYWNIEVDGKLIRTDECYAITRWRGHEWVSVEDENYSFTDPTHFMPLPPPPGADDAG